MPRGSMLNVPYTGVPEVESRDRPAAWQNIKVSEDAFGAAQGKALQQLGGAIGQLGNTIGAQMEKNQAEDDGTRARAIDTEVMKQYTAATAEYSLLNGEQAVNTYADHEKRIADIRDNAIKQAGGNKSVERMVRSSVEGQYRRAWSTAFGIKTKGHIEHGDQVSTARIDAAQQRAQVTMDEEELTSSINIIAGETNEKARRNNWSKEVTDLEIKNKSSTAYTGYIGNMARHYPAQAQQYFDKYQDKLTPEGKNAAEKAIAAGFAGAGAQEQRENIRRGLPPELPRRRDITPPRPPAPVEPPGRPGGQRSEVEPEPQTRGIQLASLTTGTMSDAPPPGAQRLAETQAFDPAGDGYDEERAKDAKMERDETGHMGSVAPATDKEKKEFNLPDESYVLLKGEKHETWDKAVEAEQERGFEVVKIGDRYYSVPKDAAENVKQPGPKSEKVSDMKVADSTGRLPRLAPPTPRDHVVMPGYTVSTGEVRDYIVLQARRRGIDPGTALTVYESEGSTNWKSTVPGENSWGPFQLYTGGGLGNKFMEAGHGDPSNPKTWKENIEFALNNVVEGGWKPWNGAKARGIVGKMGVANNARVIPVGDSIEKQMMSHPLVPGADEDGDEPVTPLQERTLTGLKKVISAGDPNAVAQPGSRVIEAQNIPGRTRALPVAPQLKSALETAANVAGVTIRVTSGGQTSDRNPAKKDQPGGWTGSLRHNDGNAGDIDILDENGKKLERNDPRRLRFLTEVAKNGAGGIGTGYMGDPLKVHVGLTGGSGQVGVGLGVYSKESTKEEVAAIRTGLAQLEANGGPVQGPSVPGGNVRYASYAPTGTMSDAPQPGFNPPSAVQRYAQATTTDAVSPFNGPITAETTEANIRARMKWIEDDARAKGHEESYAKSLNADMAAEWQAAKSAKVETHALAHKAIEDAVYGKDATGKTKTKDEIFQDPTLSAQWKLLTEKEKDQMEKQIIARDSVGENRPPTPADFDRLDRLRSDASMNPDVVRNIDLSEWPKGLRAAVRKLRDDTLANGANGTAETKEINAIMGSTGVEYQLVRAEISQDKDPEAYASIRSKMMTEVRLWKERTGKPPDPKEAAVLMNTLLRTEVVPGKLWGTNEIRRYQKTPDTTQQKDMVNDWNKANEGNPVKSYEDIPPSQQWYWMRKKEEAAARRARGAQ